MKLKIKIIHQQWKMARWTIVSKKINKTIELIGLEAIDVLSDFKQRKTDLQNKYGGAALKLCHILLNAFHTLMRIKKT